MTIQPPPSGDTPRQQSIATPASVPVPAITPRSPAVDALATGNSLDLRPLDVAGALRILVAEVRAALIEQVLLPPGAPLPPAAENLSSTADQPGNVAAQTLRWLQATSTTATAQSRSGLEQAITTGYARALSQVQEMAGGTAATAAIETAQLILLRGLPQITSLPFRADLPIERMPPARRRKTSAGRSERVDPVASFATDDDAPSGGDEQSAPRDANDAVKSSAD